MNPQHPQHIKKVIVTDELTTPEARAERLRRIRNMANLSRQEICNDELNVNTYKGWEIARYGGLPIDGAEKVVNRVLQQGVICSAEWLLYGKGRGPYVLPKEGLFDEHSDQKETISPNALIIKEIMVFQSFYPNAFFIEIEDDGMSPIYEPGDFVAGIRKYGNEIAEILNTNCIVQMNEGKAIARHLRASELPNKFQLICTNINTSVKSPIIQETEIEFAALIVRHYSAIKN